MSGRREFNRLRSRAPAHAEELFEWTSRFLETTHLEETEDERRLRHAACLLSDIAWRAHPDYRAEQSHDLDRQRHADRHRPSFARLSRALRVLSPCLERPGIGPVSRSLVSARQLDRARILGAAMRVAYILSAAMPGVLPRTPLTAAGRKDYALAAVRSGGAQQRAIAEPAKQFARLIGGDPEVRGAA